MRYAERARWGRTPGLLVALVVGTAVASPAADFDDALRVRTEGNVASGRSQERIDQLSEEADRALREYRSTLEQIDALRAYNRQMQTLIGAQQAEMSSLRGEIDRVALVGRAVTPLMLQMIESLDQFVELDIPFLLDERRQRVALLRELMDRADVSNAEKYRRIVEAFQIENDFGRTIEAYRGEVGDDDGARTVDFLRLGRIGLYYQTLDASEAGAWDREALQWVDLPSSFRSPIRQGLRIARKQAAPDMLRLPIPVAEPAARPAAEDPR